MHAHHIDADYIYTCSAHQGHILRVGAIIQSDSVRKTINESYLSS